MSRDVKLYLRLKQTCLYLRAFQHLLVETLMKVVAGKAWADE